MTHKILQRTVTEKISKEGDECMVDPDYSPDNAMMTQLTNKVGCNVPWSKVQLQGVESCDGPGDFAKYINKSVELQNEISQISKKCTYNTWNALPFEEETASSETNSTFLYAALFSDSGKVSKNMYMVF